MLINVFGVWLMAANIALLDPNDDNCTVYLVSGAGYGVRHIKHEYEERSCDEVAAEINRQVKAAQGEEGQNGE